MASPKLTTLAKELRALKDQKEGLEGQLKAVNKQLQGLIMTTLPEAMDDAEQTKFSVDGVGTVFLKDTVAVSILKDDRPAVYEWCRENGHAALVVDYIFPQTMNAWAKEQLANGAELPPNVKATFLPQAQLRRK